jgi:LEA14-like dessication related protein
VLSGCSLLASVSGRFEPPDLRIQHSRIDSITSEALAVSLTVEVYNPNPYALQIQQMRYALDVAAQELAAGEITEPFELSESQSHVLTLPLVLRLPATTQSSAVLALAELPYDLRVTLTIRAALRQRHVQVSQASVLRLDLPLGLAADPAAGEIDLLASSQRRG